MINLNETIMKKMALGVTLGITTSIVMLLITQAIILPLYSSDNPINHQDQIDSTELSPLDWDFSNTTSFIETLKSDAREDGLLSYLFTMGYFRNLSQVVTIQTVPFYENRTILLGKPVYEEYPHTIEIGNETEFNLEMSTHSREAPYLRTASITNDDFAPVTTGLVESLSFSNGSSSQLNQAELSAYYEEYYKINNTILIFYHLYNDGSTLWFEMINSEVIHIEFTVASLIYIDENSIVPNEEESSHFLIDLESFDSTLYLEYVIEMINNIGV